eukprot:9947043-Heterocapsa_arctica.AAC.1
MPTAKRRTKSVKAGMLAEHLGMLPPASTQSAHAAACDRAAAVLSQLGRREGTEHHGSIGIFQDARYSVEDAQSDESASSVY